MRRPLAFCLIGFLCILTILEILTVSKVINVNVFTALSSEPQDPDKEAGKFDAFADPHEGDSDNCINLRGTSGYWELNATFGRSTFYRGAHMFRPNNWYRANGHNESAVYPGTMYQWKDTSLGSNIHDSPAKECQINPLGQELFCHLMRKLEIRRIMFVGDSLTGSQLESFEYLIGHPEFDHNRNKGIAFPITCSAGAGEEEYPIDLYYARQNLGPNLRKTDLMNRTDAEDMQQFGPEIPYCVDGGSDRNENSCPWNVDYNSTTDKTLLILNQGAHFHSVDTFSGSFDRFVDIFNTMAHPGDIVVFRATVPGHRNCFNLDGEKSKMPKTHDEFLQRYGTSKYDWDLFDAYNMYAKKKLKDIVPTVHTHYLNVYNMTVLRPDQHVTSTDCLHYTAPGPVDYWNHLLFTNLADFATKYSW